jgi:hypothetical protein
MCITMAVPAAVGYGLCSVAPAGAAMDVRRPVPRAHARSYLLSALGGLAGAVERMVRFRWRRIPTEHRQDPTAGGQVARATAERWRRGHKVANRRKKECLILTNKAIMLLKTKDRENEQSQTKPIFSMGKPSGVAAGCPCPTVPRTAAYVLVGERSALPMTREPERLPYPNTRVPTPRCGVGATSMLSAQGGGGAPSRPAIIQILKLGATCLLERYLLKI